MSEATLDLIRGDRPIGDALEDRLGFAPLANRLAFALVHQASADGLVFGMEGSWGSGKSSLLNLTIQAFNNLSQDIRPVVVEFKPWLIGDRDALITSFFAQLANEIEDIEIESGYPATKDAKKRRELAGRIRAYAEKADNVGSVIKALPFLERIGAFIQSVSSLFKKTQNDPSLLKQKQEIDKSLGTLKRRIIVTIDDVDRLEPKEIVEILRLVRSVADFKNVTYLLCFDENILAHSIEAGIGISDGHAYLEKIIQVNLTVPIPEPYHLRRWFEQSVSGIFHVEDYETNQRLSRVIDYEGGRRFTTPRTVIRAINALTLLLPSLYDKIDLPDFVWLHIIKASDQKFYRWIEEYVSECAASMGLRVSISDSSKVQAFERLKNILEISHIQIDDYKYELSEHLPGVSTYSFMDKEGNVPIFYRQTEEEVQKAISGKRISSPDHYRLYFALAQPYLAPTAGDFINLAAAADASTNNVADMFLEWSEQQDQIVGTKADVILNRLRLRNIVLLSSEQAKRVLVALSNILDEAGRRGVLDDFRSPSIWREAERCIPVFRRSMNSKDFSETAFEIFEKGEALGWLTDILRSEIFSHGIFGNRETSKSEWIFTETELSEIVNIMISRFRAMSFKEFANLPNTISAFCAWEQAGDIGGPKKLIDDEIKSDEDLVFVLEKLSSSIRSSEGIYMVLSRRNISSFIEYDASREKIKIIANTGDYDLKQRANSLLEKFAANEHF